jgi:hypothetical protein
MSVFNSGSTSIGQQLLDVPMGDMIRDMAFAIADAQYALDENSIEVAEMMGGLKTIEDGEGNVIFEDSRVFFGTEIVTVSQAGAIYEAANANDPIRAALIGISSAPPPNTTLPFTIGSDGVFKITAGRGSEPIKIPARLSMLELGFTPNFYQFVDTIIEVKIAIRFSRENSSEVKVDSRTKSHSVYITKGKNGKSRSTSVTTTQVNATYSSKYSYSAEGSSLLRTKLVPIPPPAILEERIRREMDARYAKEQPTPPLPQTTP